MAVNSILILAFSLWISPSFQAPPFIDNQPISWLLLEDAADDHKVGCIRCIHTDDYRVNLVSVTVTQGSTPRCTTCFTVRQISPVSDYCVFYSSNTIPTPAETLQFSLAQKYNARVECTDDTETSYTDVDIRIIPNAAPVFTGPLSVSCPAPIDAATTAANQDVYTGVVATDNNGDNIVYSMTSDPVNDVFDIVASTGKIYTLLPVSRFCYHTVIFYVSITDTKTPPTGPLTITCAIANYNTAPLVSNANRDFYIDEDAVVGGSFYTFLTPPSSLAVTYTISNVEPNNANHLFTFTGNSLEVAAKLNYEDFAKRNPNITITVTNGQCPPADYYLHVKIRDKNDPPVVTPKAVTHTQAEGTVISFSLDTAVGPGIDDEDVEDAFGPFDYTIVSGNPSGLWTVNVLNQLVSTLVWDREVHGASATLTLQVADRKGPAFDTITVTIVITDVNDNPPFFTNAAFSFPVTDCTPAGSILGTLAATDADSNANNNNIIVFQTVSMNNIGVNAAGQVTLLSSVSVGMAPSVMVGANDLGTPSQTSPWNATVSLTVSVCPPPTSTPSPCNSSPVSGTLENWWAHIAALVAAFANGN